MTLDELAGCDAPGAAKPKRKGTVLNPLHQQVAADFIAELRPVLPRFAVAQAKSAARPPETRWEDVPDKEKEDWNDAASAVIDVLVKWEKLIVPDDPTVGLTPDEKALLAIFK